MEKTRSEAVREYGYRNFENYRLRVQVECEGFL